LENLETL